MAAVLTGMVPYTKLNVEEPVAVALDMHPQIGWLGTLVKIGVIAGMTSVILMSLLGQPRILREPEMRTALLEQPHADLQQVVQTRADLEVDLGAHHHETDALPRRELLLVDPEMAQLEQVIDAMMKVKPNIVTIGASFADMADVLVRGDASMGLGGWAYQAMIAKDKGVAGGDPGT